MAPRYNRISGHFAMDGKAVQQHAHLATIFMEISSDKDLWKPIIHSHFQFISNFQHLSSVF